MARLSIWYTAWLLGRGERASAESSMSNGAIAVPCIEMLTARDLAYRVSNAGARGIICRSELTQKFQGVTRRVPVLIAIGETVPGWSKAGTSILFGPWTCGACAFFFDGPFSPARRLELLEKHGITVYCAPATELYRVVNEDVSRYDLSALKRTVSAGEAMNPAVAKRWQDATGTQVAEAYGQTEALMLTLNYPNEVVKPGSMGLPAPGSDVDIIDDRGMRAADLEDGRVAVRAPNPQMMLEYWQEPERTASCFLDGPQGRWYVTGDRGHRDDQGYLWFSGRDDDVINSAGYRIGPLEVENVLLEHDSVQECAVVGAPDPERGEIVKAFVVLREDIVANETLARALQEHVRTLTAPYKYPRVVEFVTELPRTVTGKIRRGALRTREREPRAVGRRDDESGRPL